MTHEIPAPDRPGEFPIEVIPAVRLRHWNGDLEYVEVPASDEIRRGGPEKAREVAHEVRRKAGFGEWVDLDTAAYTLGMQVDQVRELVDLGYLPSVERRYLLRTEDVIMFQLTFGLEEPNQ